MDVITGIGLELSSSSAVSVSSSSSLGIVVKKTASGQQSFRLLSVSHSGSGSFDDEQSDAI